MDFPLQESCLRESHNYVSMKLKNVECTKKSKEVAVREMGKDNATKQDFILEPELGISQKYW